MNKGILSIPALLLALACGAKHEARSPEDAAATDFAGKVEPLSESERAILKALDDLPPDEARSMGGEKVIAGEPYFAASGTSCREVTYGSKTRLACREEDGWYFVPSVYGVGGE